MGWNYLAVAIGGAVGCCARYGLSQLIHLFYGRSFPVATLTINVVGSFVLGFLFFLTLERLTIGPTLRVAILTGGLGGFTTFSTFMVETLILAEEGAFGRAALYVLLSVVLGFAAAFAGGYLSRVL
ncbi:MAG TPA: fluoride efflux transporter CrcB [Gammaproteobacteria bacterium]|nr:fluoride efflux transporter CrcB [Gammaproteobacteria bacterium]